MNKKSTVAVIICTVALAFLALRGCVSDVEASGDTCACRALDRQARALEKIERIMRQRP